MEVLQHIAQCVREPSTLSLAPAPDSPVLFTVERVGLDDALARIDRDEEHARHSNELDVAISTRASIAPDTRRELVRAELTVIRKSRKKNTWNFNCNGMKITAAVTDQKFHDLCEASGIRMGRGYVVTAGLTITQHYLVGAKVWVNHSYEVTTIYSFGPSAAQRYDLGSTDPTGSRNLWPCRAWCCIVQNDAATCEPNGPCLTRGVRGMFRKPRYATTSIPIGFSVVAVAALSVRRIIPR